MSKHIDIRVDGDFLLGMGFILILLSLIFGAFYAGTHSANIDERIAVKMIEAGASPAEIACALDYIDTSCVIAAIEGNKSNDQ